VSRFWFVAASIVLCSCGRTNSAEVTFSGGGMVDAKTLAQLTSETLDYWDRSIGYRDQSLFVRFTPRPGSESSDGMCHRWDQKTLAGIEIYVSEVMTEEAIRGLLLHELAHCHMTGTAADHIHEPGHVLSAPTSATEFTDADLEALGVSP
jgi:hypothetical protein